jgi:hypothetical protein
LGWIRRRKIANWRKVIFLFDILKEFGGKAEHSSPKEIFIYWSMFNYNFLIFSKKDAVFNEISKS